MMKYKIKRTDHKKLTQGLLRFCMMIPSFYYEPGSKEECVTLMELIKKEFKNTTFLRRNNWEPLLTANSINYQGYGKFEVVSLADNLYNTF